VVLGAGIADFVGLGLGVAEKKQGHTPNTKFKAGQKSFNSSVRLSIYLSLISPELHLSAG